MKHHKLFYASSYDRGLQHLLKLWPRIKEKYSDATLDIAYGWNLFDRVSFHNPERMAWKEKMVELMKQDGITEHGRVGKAKLQELRKQCGILAYPAHFTEIFCITVVEAMRDGLVPITTDLAALKETNKTGIQVTGDIYDPDVQEEYLKALLDLMGNPDLWKSLSDAGKEAAKDYDWNKIAHKWQKTLNKPQDEPLVTIYTPTIRKGWWNIMAKNISEQTYKNVEWLIVDDAEEDRSHLVKHYSNKYGITINYMRGKPRKVKRTYGLVNANNTAMQQAKGELLVFLQDFVLMPLTGIEELVCLYRKYPYALLAPVDRYVVPLIPPVITQEDWWSGYTDVEGQEIRRNVRIQGGGLRFSENPYDFEQNYGAIPVKIAKELGGWYEFYDEGLGYDNTDIAFRALMKGYKILVDENNMATCVDHWGPLSGTRENVIGRARKLNDPRYIWAQKMIEEGKLPIVRTQKLDDKIQLLYEIPEEVSDDDVVIWLRQNGPEIVANWLKEEYV